MNKSSLMKLKKETLVDMIIEGGAKEVSGVVMGLNVQLFPEAKPVKNKKGVVMEGREHIGKASLTAKVGDKEAPAIVGVAIFKGKGKLSIGVKYVTLTKAFQTLIVQGIKKQVEEGRVVVK